MNALPRRALALASLVALSACSKKNDDATPTPVTYNTTWTIDGKIYTGTNNPPRMASNRVTLSASYQDSNGDGSAISMNVPGAVGTYTLNGYDNVGFCSITTGGTSTIYFGTSGAVTISTYSASEIIGTFAFPATSTTPPVTKTIMNGKFACKL